MASVLTVRMPEVINLGKTHPTLHRVEHDVCAATFFVHLALVVHLATTSFVHLTEDDDVIKVALN